MKNLKIFCNHCKKNTNHSIIFNHSVNEVEVIDGQSHLLYYTDFSIVQCKGCDSITFMTVDSYTNFLTMDHDGKWTIIPKKSFYRYYPERIGDLLEEKKFVGIPANIKLIYREIIDGYNIGQRILCAAGLRSIIEAACNFLGISKGSLVQKIQILSSTGHLGKSLAEALDTHRLIGNKAVHGLSVPAKEELLHAIDLVEQMLEQIFNVPDKSTRLKELVNKRVSKE